jgi:olfactory receptor
MLVNFLSEKKTISYAECLTQMYFFLVFGNIDSYLLAAMAIDRYVAICIPFHYVTVMNHRCCVWLVAFSITFSYLHSLLHVLLVNRLTFCASNVIHHFFCDVNPVLKLSCSSTFVNEVVSMTEGLTSVMAPFICIIISYLRIFTAVLKIPSAAGKLKAFSTCSSHLTVVTLFYGSISYVYIQPLSSYTVKDRIATINYTVLTSMLNPFIYSLRNKDVKRGLEKLINKIRYQMGKFSSTKV